MITNDLPLDRRRNLYSPRTDVTGARVDSGNSLLFVSVTPGCQGEFRALPLFERPMRLFSTRDLVSKPHSERRTGPREATAAPACVDDRDPKGLAVGPRGATGSTNGTTQRPREGGAGEPRPCPTPPARSPAAGRQGLRRPRQSTGTTTGCARTPSKEPPTTGESTFSRCPTGRGTPLAGSPVWRSREPSSRRRRDCDAAAAPFTCWCGRPVFSAFWWMCPSWSPTVSAPRSMIMR